MPSSLTTISHSTTISPTTSSARNSLDIAATLSPGTSSEPLDLVCIGFGPASLAIGIALSDKLFSFAPESRVLPRVQFLEKQSDFAWHAGMQLPGAHMQISFLKDLATPRDPCSPFTFINYLKSQGRLQKFINLGTFLPARTEYEDYMRWCSSHFSKSVRYSAEITKVIHNKNPQTGKVDSFTVQWTDHTTGVVQEQVARHVVIATGGCPFVPEIFKLHTAGKFARFQHSSRYITTISAIQEIRAEPEKIRLEVEATQDKLNKSRSSEALDADSLAAQMIAELSAPAPRSASRGWAKTSAEAMQLEAKISSLTTKYNALRHSLESIGFGKTPKRFLVVGGGQSAAEIYCDLQSRFPDSQVCIVLKGPALRPSDDSPFVNEIFDPERVDGCYAQDPEERRKAIILDKATNYGVVRLELLEKIYGETYLEGMANADETQWHGRIIPDRTVTEVVPKEDGTGVTLTLAATSDLENGRKPVTENVEATMVFYATGYQRDAYKTILADSTELLPEGQFVADRNYALRFAEGKVAQEAGVWLQGCNEQTHGVSTSPLTFKARTELM